MIRSRIQKRGKSLLKKRKKEYLISMDNNLINKQFIDPKSDTFEKVVFLYDSAIKELKTKIEILQDEMKLFYGYEPIESISTRVKSPESILKKLNTKGYEPTYENLFEKINDVAGVRIVCNFKKDVYKIAETIENFQDIRVLNKKDYLKTPKKSGYRSYHLVVSVPVSFSEGTMYVKVEVQIRTIGMNFWASLEHKLKYKNDNISKGDSKSLEKYAKVINSIDDGMFTIYDKMADNNDFLYIEAADDEPNLKKFKFKL